MKTRQFLTTTLWCAMLLTLSGAQAAGTSQSGDMRQSGSQSSTLAAQARSNYAQDMKRCAELAGADKAVCMKEAKAVQAEALAAARKGKAIGDEDPQDASAGKTEADYMRAMKKCDGRMGEAKTSCIAAVNTMFGKY